MPQQSASHSESSVLSPVRSLSWQIKSRFVSFPSRFALRLGEYYMHWQTSILDRVHVFEWGYMYIRVERSR